MKKLFITLLFFCVLIFNVGSSYAQKTTTYTRPRWAIGLGPVWNLATNDAYGRANYNSDDQVLRDNYGMRWGWGGYLFGKYCPGKKATDRIYLGFDYKGMTNADFSDENKTKYDILTVDAGYEYQFWGTYGFRSYYGGGLTGNFISGQYTAKNVTATNYNRKLESTFRMGIEFKAGLEFVFKNNKRNLGVNLGARYNLMNLFNDDNKPSVTGQTENINLNDGASNGGPGYKRYMGMVSIDLGINIYPDVKKITK